MKKIITTILLILLLLACLLGGGVYYLNSYYLPQKLKIQITQALSEKINAHVAFANIRFSLVKGIVIEDARVASKKGAEPFLRIKHLSANVLPLPSFKQKKIIIPSINIHDAQLNVVRLKDGTLNLVKFFPKKETKTSPSLNIPFLIYSVSLSNSNITFVDNAKEDSTKLTLALKKVNAHPNPTHVTARIQATLSNEVQATPLEFSGKYLYATKKIEATLTTKRLNILPYLTYVKKLPIDVKAFTLDSLLINSEYSLLKKKLSLKVKANIGNAYLAKDQMLLSEASAILEASALFDYQEKSLLEYDVALRNLEAELQAPQLPAKTLIQDAKLTITPQKLTIETVKARTLDTRINCSGTLENFTDPTYTFVLSSNFSLAKAGDVAQRYVEGVKSFILDGNAVLDAEIKKRTDKKNLEFKGSLTLNNASVATKNKSFEADSINGLIHFTPDTITWSNLSLRAFDNTLTSKASIHNLTAPSVNLEVTGNTITLKTKVTSAQKNTFSIEQLAAHFFGSSLTLSGRLAIADPQTYSIDCTLTSQLDLRDLSYIKQLPSDTLATIRPTGIIALSGTIKGNAKNPAHLHSSLSLTSDAMRLYNVKLSNIDMQLVQQNGQIKIPQSKASFYGGSLALNGLADVYKEDMPFALKIIADDIDLSLLKYDTAMREKEFRGILSSTAVVSGDLKSVSDVKGQGDFFIKDGYLWAFNPLAKLRDFLFIPRRQILVFREAEADFKINNKRAFTDNLQLRSDMITLACEGSIGFDKTLDFEITPVPVTTEETQEPQIQDIFSENFLKLAGVAIVTLKGTIDKPQIGQRVLTKDAIRAVTKQIGGNVEKTADEVLETLKGLGDLIFGGGSE